LRVIARFQTERLGNDGPSLSVIRMGVRASPIRSGEHFWCVEPVGAPGVLNLIPHSKARRKTQNRGRSFYFKNSRFKVYFLKKMYLVNE
jgi:hypothetical protein